MTSIDHIDLNLLRVFQAIVEEHSLTRAGERLALSQPAVSYSLGRLRTLFDDTLFVRTRTGMQPTPVALELAEIVGSALDTVRQALRHAERFDPATSTRTFRLSLSDAGEMAYLPAICAVLHDAAPRVKLVVAPLPVEEIEEALRASRLDFAIGNLPSLLPRTRHCVLFEESYVCMTRKRDDLPDGKKLKLEQFLAASHVQVRSLEHSHDALDDALRAQGVGRNIALVLPHFVAAPGVLAATDLFATLPEKLARILNKGDAFNIYALPVPLPKVAVTMHWREHFHDDEGNAWMRDLMTDTLASFKTM
ncbi:LysR family transcriptional regulator [Burkholderia cenocepacia]|uniref:LysR family transcriptional regulator n=1 Tax=Burkholderia cenocepacia TaxID=95486 RepID=UPI000980F791|nr:LysR family transcriptional regulator [Burkholderia cenocepacia]ONR72167.1 LysR family transcriptional regulator [Burkholderia cenocepacia]ONS28655.1 LysR family transcriptional regulator [Burkholderia cenocepacia]ONS36993.1 LysR family transcriptional regulator [Burkholderia cenocepacia]